MEINMKEYLMSIAMYSLKYAEAFKYNEDDVSNALGYVFRVYQEDVKYYEEQELSLLVCLLSQVEEDKYKEYIDIYTKERIDLIIKYSKDIKDSLTLSKIVLKEYKKSKGKLDDKKLEKEFAERLNENS
jgi:hypothetical protein